MEKSEFQQHPLWGEIRARITYWDEDETAISQPLQSARERARAVGNYVLALKSAGEALPALFSASMLESARSQWSTATVSYDSDSNYPNMLSGLDGVLDVVARWPGAKTAVSNARAVTEIYASAEAVAHDTLSRHIEAREEAEAALEEARSLSQKFQATVKKIDGALVDQEQRAGELAAARQKEHHDELKAMQQTFDEWLEQRKDSYKTMTARRDQQQQEFIDRAEENLAQIVKLREDVGNIVGATTSEQMSKSYKDEATREFKLAAGSYVLGFLALVGLAIFLIQAMSTLGPSRPSTWQYMSLKVGVSAALVTAATVMFSLGHKFLESSRAHKRMSMELVAMIPFLADLEEDQAGSLREAKLGFFDRAFGQQPDRKPEQIAAEDTQGLVRTVADLGKTIADMGKRTTG